MGPVLIWPNITISVYVVFQEILALTRVRHMVSSERVTADTNVAISNILMQLICDIPALCGKWNSHAFFIHTSHLITNNPFVRF